MKKRVREAVLAQKSDQFALYIFPDEDSIRDLEEFFKLRQKFPLWHDLIELENVGVLVEVEASEDLQYV